MASNSDPRQQGQVDDVVVDDKNQPQEFVVGEPPSSKYGRPTEFVVGEPPQSANNAPTTTSAQANPQIELGPNITPLDQVKRLGNYSASNPGALDQLISRLQEVIKPDGVVNGQKVTVLLQGESQPRELTTDSGFPSRYTEEQRKNILFASDIAAILGGIAKATSQTTGDDLLKQYGNNTDDLIFLKEIGKAEGTDAIAEDSVQNQMFQIKNNLGLFQSVLQNFTNVGAAPKKQEVQEAEVSPPAEKKADEAKDEASGGAVGGSSTDADEAGGETGLDQSQEEAAEEQEEVEEAEEIIDEEQNEVKDEQQSSDENKEEERQTQQQPQEEPTPPPVPNQISPEIEKEINAAYQRAVFELFSAHGISEDSVPGDMGLQTSLGALKDYIRQQITQDLGQLSEKEWLKYYLSKQLQSEYLPTLYKKLNLNQQFNKNLADFYNALAAYYQQQGNPAKKQQLQESLQSVVSVTSAGAEVVGKRPDSKKLFSQQVLSTINSDSEILLTSVSSTLDSLIMNYGVIETQRLIMGVRPEMLEITLGLPKGSITTTNADKFRTLLSDYTVVRQAVLARVSQLPEQGIASLGGVDNQKADYKNISDDAYSKRVAPAINARSTIAAEGNGEGDVVAEATAPSSSHQKVQKSLALLDQAWKVHTPVEQLAIYLYYDIPVPAEIKNQFSKGGRIDPNASLPLVFEFLDFEEADPDQSLLKNDLVPFLMERKGKIFKGQPFRAQLLAWMMERSGGGVSTELAAELTKEEASIDYDNAEKYVEEVADLKSRLGAAMLAEMSPEEQQRLSQELGYDVLEAYKQSVNVESYERDDGSIALAPVVNFQIINQVPDAMRLALINDELNAKPSQRTVLSSVLRAGGKSGSPTAPRAGSLLGGAIKNVTTKKLARKPFDKAATSLLAKAGLNTLPVVGTALALGLSALQNKKLREIAAALATYGVAQTMYALSTLGGAAGSVAFGIGGFLMGGPVGMAAGGLFGAHLGSQIWPTQWGNSVGFSPNQPPTLGNMISPETPVDPSQSMASVRAGASGGMGEPEAIDVNIPEAEGINISAGGGKGLASPIPPGEAAAAAPTTTSALAAGAKTGAAAGTGYVWYSLASPAVLASMIGVGAIMGFTFLTILITTGAFIVPLPTRDTSERSGDIGERDGSKYVKVTKTPSITQIENNTPTEVTYTITVEPQGNYSLKINEATDIFSGFGGDVPDNVASPISGGSFPFDPIDSTFSTEYSVVLGEDTVDTLVNNTLTIWFDVIDANGYTTVFNQKYVTSASVAIGDPPVGCWPSTGFITQLPGGSFSHSNADAFDIAAPAGTPIYAPFAGEACRLDTSGSDNAWGYGVSVVLDTRVGGVDLTFVFGHMRDSMIPHKSANDTGCRMVSAGSILGTVDSTGNSSGNHLHFELKPNRTGLKLADIMIDGRLIIDQFRNRGTANVNNCAQ